MFTYLFDLNETNVDLHKKFNNIKGKNIEKKNNIQPFAFSKQ